MEESSDNKIKVGTKGMACKNPFDYKLATTKKIKLRKDAYDCGIICKFYIFNDF